MLEKYPLVKVGYLKKAFGLKGEFSTRLFVADERDIGKLPSLYLTDEKAFVSPVQIAEIKIFNRQYIFSFKDIQTRTQAEYFRGCFLVCPKKDLGLISHRHENWALLSVKMVDKNQGLLGTVQQVIPTPAHNILRVLNEEGHEYFIPFNETFITSYSREKRQVNVLLPDELLQDIR